MALLILILPGAVVARSAQLSWPIAVAIAPALTYGMVSLAIIPFGALGIPWNAGQRWPRLAVVTLVTAVLSLLLRPASATAPANLTP